MLGRVDDGFAEVKLTPDVGQANQRGGEVGEDGIAVGGGRDWATLGKVADRCHTDATNCANQGMKCARWRLGDAGSSQHDLRAQFHHPIRR